MKSSKYLKIDSIREIQRYKLPHPETVFIFNFKKQEKDIDKFLKGKEFVTIRTDKKGKTDFCPHSLRCRKSKVKQFVKDVLKKGYAVILQAYLPIRKGRILSGNISIFKNYILLELMGVGPLTWLNRQGKMEEQVKFDRKNLKKLAHFGKKLAKDDILLKIVKLVRNIPSYKILEFTLRKEGVYFWQIKDDKTLKLIK